ncbi:MAG: ATP-binding protein [Bacteroidales bacterium]|jgi:predicted HTH transcriptional regulator|nr:ATP-binding protein [Bacteroidales bacterium]
MIPKKEHYIKNLIAQGEHDRQDFKFVITEAAKIAKSLSAFANTHGGTLLIGVKNNGMIAGVRSDEELYMVDSAARRYCKPEVNFLYENWNVEGKHVLEVKIPKAEQRPVFCKDENDKYWAYIRFEDQNILAHPAQVLAWKQERQPNGTIIRYTEKEAQLFQTLTDYQTLTFNQIKKKSGLKHFELLHLLGDMIALRIIGISQTEEHCSFYLKNITE